VPYLNALEVCVHDKALYKSTFTLPFLTLDIGLLNICMDFQDLLA